MFDWYEIFDYNEFDLAGVPSRSLSIFLEGIGFEDVLITKGGFISVVFRGVFLPVGFLNRNPYERGNLAVYRDTNDKVWLGIKIQ
jgi:hypothetical protein